MKRKLLFASLFFGSLVCGNAQTTIFEDSFETYNDFIITGIGNWLTLDVDGSTTYAGGGDFEWDNRFLPQAFIIFNPTAAGVTNNATPIPGGDTELRNFDPKTGSKYAGSWAAVMPGDGEGGAGPNNDWLISPQVTLGTTGNTVKFWVKSLSNTYGLDTYRVGVYTGTGTPSSAADFTIISGAGSLTAPYGTWEEKTFPLDAYAGQTIRIAIHNNSVDHYFLMVDDFSVITTSLGVNDVLASKFSVYPNPTTNGLINIANNSNISFDAVTITDLNGRTLKSVKLDNVSDAQINISDLASGIYMMNISSDQGSTTKKIIKS